MEAVSSMSIYAGNAALTVEAFIEEEVLFRASNNHANKDIQVEHGGTDDYDDSPPIFEARTAISQSTYPRETVVTYASEKVDLFEAFNPETGKFRAPFEGRFYFVFKYKMRCGPDQSFIYFRKNGFSYFGGGCSAPSPMNRTGYMSTNLILLEGDLLEVYSGTADLISDTVPLPFAGYWLE